MLPDAYRAAEVLETALGDPNEPSNVAGWAKAVEADEAEAYPQLFVDLLEQRQFLSHFVPKAQGGKLDSLEEVSQLIRVVARRDLTAAIALGQCFLGAVPVWIRGSDAQRARTAELLMGGRHAALALTEEAHGSDILASDVVATEVPGGWRLDGTKWLINNASRATALTVFARTRAEGGLSGFTLFLVDKERLPAQTFTHLPKQKTHGIRGADISGIRFDGAPLADDARIGSEGSGSEATLLSLQVTRIGCAAFCLGAADTALRVALDFAVHRKLYGGTVAELPHARAVLTGAFADLLACEAVAIGGWRGLHTAASQMSLTSAQVKYFVPTCTEQLIRDLAVVLGARHYLREGHCHGVFQKLMRDAQVVSLFDGSTAVNLEGIGAQLPRLKRDETAAPSLRFDVTQPLPPFDGGQLGLMNGGVEEVLQGLSPSLAALPNGALKELGNQLRSQLVADAKALDGLRSLERTALKRSVALFDLARRASRHFAAGSCIHLWVHSRHGLDGFFAQGEWLVACLSRLLDRPDLAQGLDGAPALTERMLQLHASRSTFSLLPFSLGG